MRTMMVDTFLEDDKGKYMSIIWRTSKGFGTDLYV